MKCFCKEKVTRAMKIEGDTDGDPLWCRRCGSSLDLDEAPISNNLKEKLDEWMGRYGNWIDWDKDTLLPGGLLLEKKHNEQGIKLTEQVQNELKKTYQVIFSPSSSAQSYAARQRIKKAECIKKETVLTQFLFLVLLKAHIDKSHMLFGALLDK